MTTDKKTAAERFRAMRDKLLTEFDRCGDDLNAVAAMHAQAACLAQLALVSVQNHCACGRTILGEVLTDRCGLCGQPPVEPVATYPVPAPPVHTALDPLGRDGIFAEASGVTQVGPAEFPEYEADAVVDERVEQGDARWLNEDEYVEVWQVHGSVAWAVKYSRGGECMTTPGQFVEMKVEELSLCKPKGRSLYKFPRKWPYDGDVRCHVWDRGNSSAKKFVCWQVDGKWNLHCLLPRPLHGLGYSLWPYMQSNPRGGDSPYSPPGHVLANDMPLVNPHSRFDWHAESRTPISQVPQELLRPDDDAMARALNKLSGMTPSFAGEEFLTALLEAADLWTRFEPSANDDSDESLLNKALAFANAVAIAVGPETTRTLAYTFAPKNMADLFHDHVIWMDGTLVVQRWRQLAAEATA